MIKIGVYTSMFGKTQPPQLESVESYIEYASRLKLDMIDFHAGRGFQSRDPAYLLGIKTQCLKAGLPVGYLASGGHFVGTDDELHRKLDQVRADVEMAAFLGAPMIRLFCGRPLEDAEARRREIRCFQEAADCAAERGVLVGLQNHPSTADDVLRILRETDRPNFVFLLDTGQWVGSPALNRGVGDPRIDTYRYMERTAPYAVHVRAKFYKIDSGREEWLDYAQILRILRAANFNGCVSVVFEGKDVNQCDDREVIRLAAEHLRGVIDGG